MSTQPEEQVPSSGLDPAPPISADQVNTTSSLTAIPTYPTSDTKPAATASQSAGILNHRSPTETVPQSNSLTRVQDGARPRVSLSYPERPTWNRGENISTSAGGNVDTAKSPKRSLPRGREQSNRRSQSISRNAGQSRTSLDTSASRPAGLVRRSLSLGRREGPAAVVDPMQEPRRSIGKRPDELDLAQRDPHRNQHGWFKHTRRAVPFAAPYERSGVVIDQPAKLKDWIVPGPLTFGYGQWWYLIFAQSFIAALISGAINFGVAVALYRKQPTIDIWTFNRQTVAGDMGVTIIIQQIVSFIITSSLVHHDLYAGPIGPLRRPWPPLLHLPSTPTPNGQWLGVKMPEEVKQDGVPCRMGRSEGRSKVNGWWWWFVRAVLTGSERNDLLAAGISWRQRLERLVWTAAQGFFLCCLTFWWYWPLSIAIIAPIYGGRELAGTWIPMIIKLLYGAILSLLTNPIMALMAMGAESSVRRCYPELPIWFPFGGEEDFAQWKVQHGVVDPSATAVVPGDQTDQATVSEVDAEDGTASHLHSPSSSQEQQPSRPSQLTEAQQQTLPDSDTAITEKPAPSSYTGLGSNNLLSRRITEEPSKDTPDLEKQ